MLADFPVLYVDLIVKRTIASCVVLGVVAVPACIILGQPLAGRGSVTGLAAATVNHRLFQLSTVRYSSDDGHIARKPYAGSVAGRLGCHHHCRFCAPFFVRPMGFGMIAGLVAFQVLLMANALGALWRYQRLQLAGWRPRAAKPPGRGRQAGPGPGPGHQPTGFCASRASSESEPMASAHLVAVPPIPVGDHVTTTVGGLTLNLDTIWGTLIACAVIFALGFYVRHKSLRPYPTRSSCCGKLSSAGSPNRSWVAWGPNYRHVVPIAVTIFLLVLTANWVELFPGLFHNTDWLPSPSADVNLSLRPWRHRFRSDQRRRRPSQGFRRLHQDLFCQTEVAGPDPDLGRADEASHVVAPAIRQHLLRRDHDRPASGHSHLFLPCHASPSAWRGSCSICSSASFRHSFLPC